MNVITLLRKAFCYQVSYDHSFRYSNQQHMSLLSKMPPSYRKTYYTITQYKEYLYTVNNCQPVHVHCTSAFNMVVWSTIIHTLKKTTTTFVNPRALGWIGAPTLGHLEALVYSVTTNHIKQGVNGLHPHYVTNHPLSHMQCWWLRAANQPSCQIEEACSQYRATEETNSITNGLIWW